MDILISDLSLRVYKTAKKKSSFLNSIKTISEIYHQNLKIAKILKIEILETHGTKERILRDSVFINTEMIPLIQIFRIKQKPNGNFDKLKTRLVMQIDL